MYVCLCNGYRDAEIREVAESGLRCVKEVYLTLGNGPCCGSCLDFAQDIVDGVHETGTTADDAAVQEHTDGAMLEAAE
ncbi:MAG: bacterioferritin-associated ferredoxin [Bacteroidota bacterium]|nr:(2Fe-2S)-binding protein [Kiloniellaceae bacterium]